MTPGAAAPTLHKGASPRQSLHTTTGGQGGVAGWPWSVTGQENVNLFFFFFQNGNSSIYHYLSVWTRDYISLRSSFSLYEKTFIDISRVPCDSE